MTQEDAVTQHSEPAVTSGRDIQLVTPGPDLLTDGGNSAASPAVDPIVQCARWLLLCGLGTVTFDTVAGPDRTFEVVSGMALPVRLNVFAVRVTAADMPVYAIF